MDVTNKDSIQAGVTSVAQADGKLHILVNKCDTYSPYCFVTYIIERSAGQSGPLSPELNRPSPTAQKEAGPLSEYLFNSESFEEWSSLYAINTFSIYFVTVAFLDLLDKGSKDFDKEGFSSSVINITSISGLMKVAQRHVSKLSFYFMCHR
jgi:NAD(P)-dependent dehydrogenase (short-subunit alcohol dehydrogenase family)